MDHLVVCGLNYRATPLAIRERFTIPASCLRHALAALANLPHVKEAAVLSTCNRTEVYALVSDVGAGLHEIESFFLSAQKIADHQGLSPDFKLLRDDVVLHLLRVAAGLDSMVLGEGQIMAQVKEAHKAALEAGTAGPVLDQIFKLALTCGKRVRTETAMGRRAVSVSSAAVELAREVAGPIKERTVVVVGAGQMAQILIKHLLNEPGGGPVILVNRTSERIDRFLRNSLPNRERLKTGFAFEDRHKLAAAADVVFVSTSAPEYVLKPEEMSRAGLERDLCVIDISVPRNADPGLASLPGVTLFNADDLALIVAKNRQERESLVGEAERIVFETLDLYHSWQRSLLVVPTIAELRQKIEEIRLKQMEKGQAACPSGAAGHTQQIEEISRAIVNQILHHPTVQLKATRDYEILRQQAEALRTLFNLDAAASRAPRSGRSRPVSSGRSCARPAGEPEAKRGILK